MLFRSNLFSRTEVFIAGKIHPHPTYTHMYPHTPDKTRKNYLSHKSLFQAVGQGVSRTHLAFFSFYLHLFLWGCVWPLVTLAAGSLRQALTPPTQGIRCPSSLPPPRQCPSASGRVKESNRLEIHSQTLCIMGDSTAHGQARGQSQGDRGCSNKH